jgi:hypothetical protein
MDPYVANLNFTLGLHNQHDYIPYNCYFAGDQPSTNNLCLKS